MRQGVKSVKSAHLNLMPASDEDAERSIGRAATCRPTLDHNLVFVPGKNLELHLLSTCVLVRFYEFLNASAFSVRSSVERARAHLRSIMSKGSWHALSCFNLSL